MPSVIIRLASQGFTLTPEAQETLMRLLDAMETTDDLRQRLSELQRRRRRMRRADFNRRAQRLACGLRKSEARVRKLGRRLGQTALNVSSQPQGDSTPIASRVPRRRDSARAETCGGTSAQ
jgi:hypothetical protein